MAIFQAVYENGVFRPTEPVDLPEHSPVRVDSGAAPFPVKVMNPENEALYRILLGGSRTVSPVDANPASPESEDEAKPRFIRQPVDQAILDLMKPYDEGSDPFFSERHNEHQP